MFGHKRAYFVANIFKSTDPGHRGDLHNILSEIWQETNSGAGKRDRL